MLHTISKKENHVLLVELEGRLMGEFQTVQLLDEIDELIEDDYIRIIFDLSRLEYINSTGLNFFLKILTRVRKNDGEVVLCSLNKLLTNLMVTTKLSSFFTISSTVEEALRLYDKAPVK